MNNLFKKIGLRSVLFLVAVVYLLISLISAQFDLMTKKQAYENLMSQKAQIELEVADTQSLLEESNDEKYIERIARDKLGYAYPGEVLYYDIQSE